MFQARENTDILFVEGKFVDPGMAAEVVEDFFTVEDTNDFAVEVLQIVEQGADVVR